MAYSFFCAFRPFWLILRYDVDLLSITVLDFFRVAALKTLPPAPFSLQLLMPRADNLRHHRHRDLFRCL
ncbi:MAG: hypothetical protein KDE04_25760, partial [Anaerolineales bacterium]|nr:hypothetical protein [Anaerolineales bacterium]